MQSQIRWSSLYSRISKYKNEEGFGLASNDRKVVESANFVRSVAGQKNRGKARMKYVCFKCKKEVEIMLGGRIICPFCGYRILKKGRTGAVKHVKAR